MSIEIKEASSEEIMEFKQAAAARYAELGVEPAVAQQIFDRFMGKVASEMGIQEVEVDARIQKLADAIKESTSCGSSSKPAKKAIKKKKKPAKKA